MTKNSRPVTDHFGTRLEPGALVAGLTARGLRGFRLVVDDEGASLTLSADPGGDAAACATTWLRGMLSPLMPLRVERGAVKGGGAFEDRRRRPTWIIALGEIFDEEADAGRVEAVVRARLGGEGEVISWPRPGGARGARPARIVAASREPGALAWLRDALRDEGAPAPAEADILLDGLEWGVARRPTIAASGAEVPILVDDARCDGCGICAEICPTRSLEGKGVFAPGGAERCLSCFDCVEACPQDALRPRYGPASATAARALAGRPGWLSRLRGAPGPALPAPFPPSFLLPKARPPKKPKWILGLAVTTMQEHAAALLEDGRVAGAVEEERLSRMRHHGRAGPTLAADPTLCLEEVLCRRAAGALLSERGLTLDDMDVIAVNGVPARYRRAFRADDDSESVPVLRAGRVVYVPHHLSHAASAWRLSGQTDSWVLSVDGRGDRETAAVFRGRRGRLRRVSEILSLTDRSIGGVYETVTRLLGFGAHGQGSVMALASFGNPVYDLAPFLSRRGRGDYMIHERGLAARFRSLARAPGGALTRGHKNLAASLQAALEALILGMLKDAGVPRGAALCLAGGVALNCRLNERIRRSFKPRSMFVVPAANDAGTALGAALEAAGAAATLPHAALGPSFSEEEARAALESEGLVFERSASLAADAAALLAGGEIVCWFQGRAEFGPRALGSRSILADPRRADMHARVNRLKDREAWRPFGPSVLAGRESEWFEDGFDSRFMLFARRLKKGRDARVPAVAHVDGTSRPQSVHAAAAPLYHALLSEFEARTGVPMLLNTSFNRRGEPIVCSPADAVRAFLGMPGAGVLALGPFLARRAPARPSESDAALSAHAGGRRLMLRLTARDDCEQAHAPIADIAHLPDRSWGDALRALAAGRRAACSELVIMRGEATLLPELPALLARARAMGYSFIQLQTNARRLARLAELVDAFEVTLFAADETTHDALTGRPGSLRETLAGVRSAVAAGREVALNVPVLRRNSSRLAATAALAARLGARRIQFCFPRPVETAEGLRAGGLARLSDAAPRVREALRAARAAGLAASTEGVPFCHLDADQRSGPDAAENWTRFRVDDLHRLEESLDPARRGSRPESPACRGCAVRAECPRTWASYLALFGGGELTAMT
ncbi:MAG: carbamoyltransferase C-terminal domain-containing protein [Elusimicrobiota bacterium]|nr:carbamoyltransferase C-terminal domain-containing protein [Elusimicrobiota bacterium]